MTLENVKTKKLIDFESANVIKEIQDYADSFTGGNFTLAVKRLVAKSLPVGEVK